MRDGGRRTGREVGVSKPLKDAAGSKTLDSSLDGDSSETGESEDATAPDKFFRPFFREGKWKMSKKKNYENIYCKKNGNKWSI